MSPRPPAPQVSHQSPRENWKPEDGDLVRDETCGVNAVATIVGGRMQLRPLHGDGQPWLPKDWSRVKVQARHGGWSEL